MNTSPDAHEWLAPVIPLRPVAPPAPSASAGLSPESAMPAEPAPAPTRLTPRAAMAPQQAMSESIEYNSAMDLAMKYLGPRPRSRREVGDRLKRAGHPGVLIVRILNRLEELGILDDKAYALEAARLSRAKGKSGRSVRQALATKGLSRSDIDGAIDQMCSEESEFDVALEIASKRALKYQGLAPAAAYRRLAGFLAQRGFGSELTGEICSQVLRDFPEGD